MRITRQLFYFLLIATPLAFGTVEFWSLAAMETIALTALAVYCTRALWKKHSLYLPPGSLPLSLLLIFILLQCVPLPGDLVRLLSPSSWDIHKIAEQLSGTRNWQTLSIHPQATLNEFFRYASYAAFYFVAVQLLKDKGTLKLTVVIITVFGAVLSFSSILQFYTTRDMALWFFHVPENSIIVGPYINHNHYAGLMELIFPVILSLFFFYRPRTRASTFIKGIIEILSQEKANIHLLIGAAAILVITSIFISLSRGGMISISIAMVFFTYLLMKRRISKGNTLLVISIIIVSALAVSWFGWDQILDRFSRLKSTQGLVQDTRTDFWKDTLYIIRDFFLTGSGTGTFIDIYPTYQSVDGELLISHAHNDYLELIAEAGIIGFVFAFCFCFSVLWKTFKAFLDRKDAYSVYIYMGSITGVLAILFHSVTDFNLHIGANGLWFFFTLGLAVSAANTGLHRTSIPTRLPELSSPITRWTITGIAVTLSISSLVYLGSTGIGNYYFSHIRHFKAGANSPVADLTTIKSITERARTFDPLNAEYAFANANADLFLGNSSQALDNFYTSIRLHPTNSRYLKRLGLYLATLGRHDLANLCLKESVRRDISDAGCTLEYAAALFYEGTTDLGIQYMKRAIQLDSKSIDRALLTMSIFGLPDSQIESAIPDTPAAYITWASFLFSKGKRKQAETAFLKALPMIDNQNAQQYWEVYRIAEFFRKRGKINQAIDVIQRGIDLFPHEVHARIYLGDLYQKIEIYYRARQEYEQALIIDPLNNRAKRRLERLNQ